jgi:hypothetical protein
LDLVTSASRIEDFKLLYEYPSISLQIWYDSSIILSKDDFRDSFINGEGKTIKIDKLKKKQQNDNLLHSLCKTKFYYMETVEIDDPII